MTKLTKTPRPPYYAVIFSSVRTEGDHGYAEMSEKMVSLVSKQTGFLGAESARDELGFGITISYWESLDAIKNWKANEEHLLAQEKGKKVWYENYITRICKVEREYSLKEL